MSSSCCCPSNLGDFIARRRGGKRGGAGKALLSGASAPDADEDVDIVIPALAAAGLEIKPMFATRLRRWLCLLVFSIIGAAASGPMTMWPTLEPILIQEDVFKGENQLRQLSQVFSIALGAMMMSFLFIGLVYDSYGPRFCAVVGSLLFAVTSIGMACAIQFRSLNWMLYIVYPIALFMGMGKNYGAYAFQWLLPQSQNTVNSVINATQALSDSLVVVCVYLHSAYGMSLWTYFYALAGFAVISGILMGIIVPSRKEHFENSSALVKFMEATSPEYGSTDSGVSDTGQRSQVKTSGYRFVDNLKGVYTVFKEFPLEHLFFISG